jgi:cytochrome P450
VRYSVGMRVLSRPPSTVPLAPGSAWFGHLRRLRSDLFALIDSASRASRGIVRLEIPGNRFFLATDPSAVEHVLVTNQRNYSKDTPGFSVLREVGGDGLLSAEGPTWKRHRRIIQPSFHRHTVTSFKPIIVRGTEALIQRLRHGDQVDGAQLMSQLTLQVVAELLFGMQFSAERAGALTRTMTRAFADVEKRLRAPLRLPLHWPTPLNIRLRRNIASIDSMVHETLEARRAAPGNDMLSRLLAAEDETGKLTDREIKDELNTFYAAGFETTANALAWTLYLLAKHPEERARVEQEALAGEATDELEAFTAEAMRLYPPALVFSRRAIHSDVLAGHHIPARAVLLISPYATHHAAAHWPDPYRFDPERFRSPDPARHRYAYFPFGAGPRQCIGKELAQLELNVILQTLMRARVRFDAPKSGLEVEPEVAITLRPRGGVPLRVHIGP